MKYLQYLREDAVKAALGLDEPEVGSKYPSEKVKRYLQQIDAAIKEVSKREQNDANDAIMADLRDKKKKWSNVDGETKPKKTKVEVPPDEEGGDGEGDMPPEEDDGEEEKDKEKEEEEKDKEKEKEKKKGKVPPQFQKESKLERILEGKLRLGNKNSKAFAIVAEIQSWPEWYTSDLPQKKLVDILMKKFKLNNKMVLDIFKIWRDYRDGKINTMEFQDFTHALLQGEKYSGY